MNVLEEQNRTEHTFLMESCHLFLVFAIGIYRVMPACTSVQSVLLADQFQVHILIALKMIMVVPKMEGGLFYLVICSHVIYIYSLPCLRVDVLLGVTYIHLCI